MCLATLIPHLAGLRLRQFIVMPEELVFVLAPTRRTGQCPLCQRRSARVHSRYERTLVDLPIGTRPVRLRLHVRRFRCLNPTCPRRIFGERFPHLVSVHARRTHDQREALVDFGLALGGSAGARLANRRGVRGSRATVLRCLHTLPAPDVTAPRVLGIDDWARRRGQTYGSIGQLISSKTERRRASRLGSRRIPASRSSPEIGRAPTPREPVWALPPPCR